MMLLTTSDVILRRYFNQPIFGSYEISKVLLAIAIFFGVSIVMKWGGHVNVDILTRLYPRRLKLITCSIGYFLSLIVVGLISWQTALYGIDMVQVGERSVLLRIIVSPFIFVVAFGSAVLFFVILVKLLYVLGGKLDGTS
jgi:TRAP-type C4-dicarboxylate transport system permease small subunit